VLARRSRSGLGARRTNFAALSRTRTSHGGSEIIEAVIVSPLHGGATPGDLAALGRRGRIGPRRDEVRYAKPPGRARSASGARPSAPSPPPGSSPGGARWLWSVWLHGLVLIPFLPVLPDLPPEAGPSWPAWSGSRRCRRRHAVQARLRWLALPLSPAIQGWPTSRARGVPCFTAERDSGGVTHSSPRDALVVVDSRDAVTAFRGTAFDFMSSLPAIAGRRLAWRLSRRYPP
jgi:hypothetical protein